MRRVIRLNDILHGICRRWYILLLALLLGAGLAGTFALYNKSANVTPVSPDQIDLSRAIDAQSEKSPLIARRLGQSKELEKSAILTRDEFLLNPLLDFSKNTQYKCTVTVQPVLAEGSEEKTALAQLALIQNQYLSYLKPKNAEKSDALDMTIYQYINQSTLKLSSADMVPHVVQVQPGTAGLITLMLIYDDAETVKLMAQDIVYFLSLNEKGLDFPVGWYYLDMQITESEAGQFVDVNALQRDYEKRLREIENEKAKIDSELNALVAEALNKANLPAPKNPLKYAMAGAAGLFFLALAALLLWEIFRDRVKYPSDVIKRSELDILGIINTSGRKSPRIFAGDFNIRGLTPLLAPEQAAKELVALAEVLISAECPDAEGAQAGPRAIYCDCIRTEDDAAIIRAQQLLAQQAERKEGLFLQSKAAGCEADIDYETLKNCGGVLMLLRLDKASLQQVILNEIFYHRGGKAVLGIVLVY